MRVLESVQLEIFFQCNTKLKGTNFKCMLIMEMKSTFWSNAMRQKSWQNYAFSVVSVMLRLSMLLVSSMNTKLTLVAIGVLNSPRAVKIIVSFHQRTVKIICFALLLGLLLDLMDESYVFWVDSATVKFMCQSAKLIWVSTQG